MPHTSAAAVMGDHHGPVVVVEGMEEARAGVAARAAMPEARTVERDMEEAKAMAVHPYLDIIPCLDP